MIIESLSIREGLNEKTFRFSDARTLVCSDNQNMVGKTTLIRCLLYSLGEEIPGTHRFVMSKHAMRIVLRTDQGARIKLIRDGSALRVIDMESDEEDFYSLPYDLRMLKKRIYGIENPVLTSNILGAFYIDQDKGWTLLNRGKVIGGIGFSIEELLQGLSNADCETLLQKKKSLERDIRKYSFIAQAAGYQNSLVSEPGMQEITHNARRDYERLSQLRMEATSLRKRIASIRRIQKDNKRFVDHVASMGLRVKLEDGSEVRVGVNNLVGYTDGRDYLEGESLALSAEYDTVEKQIQALEATDYGSDGLFDVPNSLMLFDRQFVSMKIDFGNYAAALESIKKEKKKIDQQLFKAISTGTPAYDTVTEYAQEYSRYLGVEKFFSEDPKGVLTSDLKSKSGTSYQLLVFAFRMAYASTVRKMTGINLPIIIDSIRGREMSQENLFKCLDLLTAKMSDHQQIVVSIIGTDIKADFEVLIENHLMEKSDVVADIAEWEAGE